MYLTSIGWIKPHQNNYSDIQNKNVPDKIIKKRNGESHRMDIVCLIYHRFGDNRYPSTNTNIQLFKNQLQYLKDNNFRVITFGKAVDMILDDKQNIDKTVAITIDDAFLSFKDNAFPLLNQFGYKATVFVNTETIGDGDYMNWEDLKSLKMSGFEIGNHSHSHAYFMNHQEDKKDFFKNDIELSKKLLLDSLGEDPKIFTYPYGEYDEELMNMVISLGFKAAAAQNSGVLCESSNMFVIPRFPMNNQYGAMEMFREKVNMKALRIIDSKLPSTLYSKNPPLLKITIEKQNYDIAHIQGFTQGGDPILSISGDTTLTVNLSCNKRLSDRRVIYTITIPSKQNNQWYWYSHLWLNPSLKD